MKNNKPTVEYVPINKQCTYHYSNKNKKCKNCNNTGTYIDGYYLIVDKKLAFIVDTTK